MRAPCGGWRAAVWLVVLAAATAQGQRPQPPSPETVKAPEPAKTEPIEDLDRPLPDIPALMHQVETHQREAEAIEKDYTYHSVESEHDIDSHGGIKKIEVNEYDVFWIEGVRVRRLLKKDGKEVSEDEKKKEDERIDKEAAKARERREKEDAKGKETDARGNDEVTVSRLLELGSFTNPHRVLLNGRDTIVVDYAGDPKAKTRNSFENVIRDMAGTVWVDEREQTIVRLEGRFVNDFKLGGGLVVNIHNGFHFSAEFVRVNNEVWLPARAEGAGSARILLFHNVNGSLSIVDSDYRKFKTSSIILPIDAPTPPPAPPPDKNTPPQ